MASLDKVGTMVPTLCRRPATLLVHVSNALDTCAPVCTLFEDVLIACETTYTQVGGGRVQPDQQKRFIHPPSIP
jgi:hypothetical protein